MVVQSRATALLLLTLALALMGCGDDPGPSESAGTASGSGPASTRSGFPDFLVTEDEELVVSCWSGIGWPASLMPAGIEGALTDDDAKAIFTELLALTDNPVDLATFLPDGPDTEWRLLWRDGDEYVFGVGSWTADGPGPDGHILTAEDRADGWKWTGGGDCRVQPVLEEGHMWVELHGADLDRSSTEPLIGLNEIECTSARDPSPYLHDPFVVETDRSVTVYWTSTPPEGGQTCPGNPRVRRPLPLDEPLGDRQLLDGSTYPPTPVGPSLPG
jgi:hypothetical protein